jgi:hypothetical protein
MGAQLLNMHERELRQAENSTPVAKAASATLKIFESMVNVTLPTGATDVTLTLPSVAETKGREFLIWIGTKTGTGKLIITDSTGEPAFQRTLHTAGQSIVIRNEGGMRYVSDAGAASEQMVKIALGTGTAAGGLLTWQNKTGKTIRINRLIIDRTTASTGAASGDFGVAATAILNDTLIDGLDLNAAAGVADNHLNPGSNGLSGAYLPADEYVTGSTVSAADPAGLVGFAYIFFTPLV